MALRDQPYFPFYTQDFASDEKVRMCSPAAVGVYIFLLCYLHKSEHYGKLILQPKHLLTEEETAELKKQIESKTKSIIKSKVIAFAKRLQRNMPFELHEIAGALDELEEEKVISISETELYQKRMVRDGEISEKRSKNGALGGRPIKEETKNESKTKTKTKTKNESKKASKNKANAEIENEYENNIIDSEEKKGDAGEREEAEERPQPQQPAPRAWRFTPPTVEEVTAYCRERANGINPQQFVDFYSTNGWKQKGGNPIKDWKACVRTWETNGINRHSDYGTGTAANTTGKSNEVQGSTTETRTRRSTI